MKVFRFRITCLVISLFLASLLPFKSNAAEDEDLLRSVFDAEYYYNENPDLQTRIGQDPEALFAHFIHSGLREGRAGNAEFNIRAYVRYNPELLDVYKTDWAAYCRHYIRTGRAEGRQCLPKEDEDPLIGFYHTNYDKTLPRAANIALAVSRINGLVLQPGEQFSFSEAVLPRIPENGYVLAPAIGGMEYGGGICQVSSTLYAAMCHAMLPAVERYPHSSRISYMPAGLDATISEGHKDLKFVNPYKKPLTILAETDETGLTVSLLLGRAEDTEDKAESADAKTQTEEDFTETDETASEPEEAGTEKEDPDSKTGEAEMAEPEAFPEAGRVPVKMLLEAGEMPIETEATPDSLHTDVE